MPAGLPRLRTSRARGRMSSEGRPTACQSADGAMTRHADRTAGRELRVRCRASPPPHLGQPNQSFMKKSASFSAYRGSRRPSRWESRWPAGSPRSHTVSVLRSATTAAPPRRRWGACRRDRRRVRPCHRRPAGRCHGRRSTGACGKAGWLRTADDTALPCARLENQCTATESFRAGPFERKAPGRLPK